MTLENIKQNIVYSFFEATRNHPNHVAFCENGRSITYKQMSVNVARKAKRLRELNVSKGDSVFMALPVGLDFYESLLAIFSVGATVVLLDDVKDKSKLKFALTKTNSKLIVTNQKLWWLRFLFLPLKYWFKTKVINQAKTSDSITPVSPVDTALITFTSGTTGLPKAAKRSHSFLNIQLETLVEEMEISPTSVHLSSLPVVLLCNLAVGAQTIFLQQKSEYKKADLISGSPYHVHQFILNGANPERVFIGGSVIYPALVRELHKRLPKSSISFAYGSTEAEPISLIDRKTYQERLNNLGLPVGVIHKNISVKISPIDHNEDIGIGEIMIKGKHVLDSYLDPKDNLNKWENGWLKTGDIGYFINETLYFLGRAKYCWNENGVIKSPLQVEIFCNQIYPKATQLQVENKSTLFYTKDCSTEILSNIKNNFSFDQEKKVEAFSYDQRHNSRINYDSLIALFGFNSKNSSL